MLDNANKTKLLADPTAGREACGVGLIASRHNLALRDIVEKSFEALKNLAHRGAIDADGKTGDGAGILTAIPRDYYIREARKEDIDLGQYGDFAVAMIFYPEEQAAQDTCRRVFESVLKSHDIKTVWSREAPVDNSVLGTKAASVKPKIWQKFLTSPRFMTRDEFDRTLYLVRKEVELLIAELSYPDFYIPSLSTMTIVHKGLFMGEDLRRFYLDLQDPQFTSPFAIFHQRFSTNTFPSWALAQPFRMLAHNGEINTIRGNRNWMHARELAAQPRTWVPRKHALKQFMMSERSDSASVDNALETYVFGGRSIQHALGHMMPEAWQNQEHMDEDLRAFYEYHACVSEHWDGPAAVAFSDGNIVGALVDRNGLRPARYKITHDYLMVCSEVGCINFADDEIEENGRLSPGRMIAINLKRKKILKNDDIKTELANRKPYAEWLKKNLYRVDDVLKAQGIDPHYEHPFLSIEEAQRLKVAFGYTREDCDLVLGPMFANGYQPTGSMGDDTPLAVFSQRPKLFYTYFKQLFAQVTNPPIDPIRERYVTSLRMYLGPSGNIFEESPQHAHQIRILTPVLTRPVFDAISAHPDFPSATLMACFSAKEGPEALEDTLMGLCLAAEKAVDNGKALIIISDRYVDRDHAPIPMLLAVSAVHHHLIRIGKRLKLSLIAESGEAREIHHFACLIGFGASAVYPYLALREAVTYGEDPKNKLTREDAVKNYITAVEDGLLKIMSKMGISVLQAYHAAQLFEAIGLNESLVRLHFKGTPCKVSGANLTDIARDYLSWHKEAFSNRNVDLDPGGDYRYRRQGEYHAFNPQLVRHLHKAVSGNNVKEFESYKKLVNERVPMTIRDLLRVKKGKPVALSKVEPAKDILKRFCSPGISFGAISKETHEDLAIAMNRLGAKSDSGEGGEDPGRFEPLPNGDSKNSAIKQVASGRFGVTAYYLSRARELEIKIAQGAKPGEGGQLHGHKVSEEIARIRHSTPGVTLISPPPHHDIYSIEDLAQLIYDLKQANPRAKVCVKLVAEDGVGTIAAGVVKAHADVILISGHDGGTGASPLDSIKHAGLPWELGIAEAQQVLVANRLRDRVTLRVDGGLKTGLDVVKAAILGAEEYGFGTTSLVAAGCIMARVCHLNTCPVGVATQDPRLRAKYRGSPERIMHFFEFITEEIRHLLAEMGFYSLNDIIGRVELLEQVTHIQNDKVKKLNLSRVLTSADPTGSQPRHHLKERNDWIGDKPFDERVIVDCKAILRTGTGQVILNYLVRNSHRSIGTQLSHKIVDRFGPDGLPAGNITLHLKGTAGQSLGAFGMKTLAIHLEGEANDYVGKGLAGAVISLRPSRDARFKPEDNVICGNTCLYGATDGKMFVNGRAGERFAVRNSGAFAVVEGVGDHACEYMTGGLVLILGDVGYNFGAGMTGGLACVYDGKGRFADFANTTDVRLFPVDWDSKEDRPFFELLKEHVVMTDSPLAKRLLENWDTEKLKFVKVVPNEILKLAQKKKDKEGEVSAEASSA